jgi:hypothetical protein
MLSESKESNKIKIFTHIPKTAGTTLRKIITENYSSTQLYQCYVFKPEQKTMMDVVNNLRHSLKKTQNSLEENSSNIKIIAGHIGFGLHEFIDLPLTNTSYITILREPSERVLSYISHIRSHFNNPLGEIARNKSLKYFIEGRYSIEIDNYQTRYLSGIGWQKIILGKGKPIPYGKCTQEMLDMAKQNLKNYYLIGIQENFSQTLSLFARELGWKVEQNLFINKNKNRINQNEVSDETIKIIKEHNQLDVELYEYAQILFQEKLKLNLSL